MNKLLSNKQSDVTEKKQNTKFKKGQSGNPAGRPKGLRNKATLAVEMLLDGQAEALTQTAINKALDGDITALRLCLERICPPRKERTITLDIPMLTNVDIQEDLTLIIKSILQSVINGELTPNEAQSLLPIVDRLKECVVKDSSKPDIFMNYVKQ